MFLHIYENENFMQKEKPGDYDETFKNKFN